VRRRLIAEPRAVELRKNHRALVFGQAAVRRVARAGARRDWPPMPEAGRTRRPSAAHARMRGRADAAINECTTIRPAASR